MSVTVSIEQSIAGSASSTQGFLIERDLVLVPRMAAGALSLGSYTAVIDHSDSQEDPRIERIRCACEEAHVFPVSGGAVIHASFRLDSPWDDFESAEVQSVLGDFPGTASDGSNVSAAIEGISANIVVLHVMVGTESDDSDLLAKASWCRFVPWC